MKLETASHVELLEAAVEYYVDRKLTAKDLALVAIAFSVNEQKLKSALGGR